VHEAERLQSDLRRAEIEPYAWVINQSLLASGTHDPVLAQRAAYEAPFIERVVTLSARRCALIPWQVHAPVGATALNALAQ
jgi:arsenite-transporting ATPase